LDVVIYKDLDAPPVIRFEDRIPSNHRSILTRIDLKDRHNKALTELVRQKGGFTFQEFTDIVRTEVQRRQKHRRPSSKNHQYRRRCYWLKPSKSLERLKESMFQAQKAGQQDRFKELRNQYQKMLKHEKIQSFNAYLEETFDTKDTKKFYDMMKRLSPSSSGTSTSAAIEKTRLPGSWPLLQVILLTLTLNKKARMNDRLYKLQPAAWTQNTFQFSI
jgi:hypothetical protein